MVYKQAWSIKNYRYVGDVSTGGDGARGCHSPPWRRRRGVSVSPSLARSWLLSSGESLDSELDRHDGGVLHVVILLGASCMKTWLGGSRLLSSGARCCPRLVCRGAMHAMAGESKTMSSRNWPSYATFLFGWCVDKGSSFGVIVLWSCSAPVETRLCCLD
jgi:hypothetical protein